ncbi:MULTISPECIES: GNAT family N-acetyltransferase [unclassified Rhizobium]|jgi:ribosomal protein S18 acetylase RimI-like enzyme|uniref:GNAT family N-acetyltransferase n=1 Tax=unclassified Rhizobium TaxID=2613769 RepID=UPI0006460063|nr:MULTISPECIES: GNAT family N-acetyltransferase [unclassified Rhizobium]MBN8954717.1 GNAT family N-acetyltransferase [Rhizobium tropici]OJY73435.1 MAG: hypothetical protein BGP09_20830 [Rhizobium sp. 60-20]RKD72425.1 ribosomal protein S18 acetylase RimI-like enzyme [Rhizobium sp. WW_1]
MLIREAAAEDTPVLLRLLRQIASSSNNIDYGADTSDEEMLVIIQDCTTFVLQKGGGVVGLNAIQLVDLSGHPRSRYKKMAFIMAFGVDEIERRQGFGTALFEHMRHWLAEKEVDYLSLNVSFSNEAAQAFYRRMGLIERSLYMEQSLR